MQDSILCVYGTDGKNVIHKEGLVSFDKACLDTEQHHYSVIDSNNRRHHYKIPFKGFLITVSKDLTDK